MQVIIAVAARWLMLTVHFERTSARPQAASNEGPASVRAFDKLL
jgi:hypothetical protein